jgi:hypothetical protein
MREKRGNRESPNSTQNVCENADHESLILTAGGFAVCALSWGGL